MPVRTTKYKYNCNKMINPYKNSFLLNQARPLLSLRMFLMISFGVINIALSKPLAEKLIKENLLFDEWVII
jgi:hypothetical protein